MSQSQPFYWHDRLYPFGEKRPVLGEGIYLSEGVKIVGEVILEKDVNIWFNSVVRGDVAFVKIGQQTNVQDLCMLHVTEESPLTIGQCVSIGHSVVIHGATIGDGCLIGMGSLILDHAVIGKECLVAAGSLIPPRKHYPDGSFIKGRPAVVERMLSPEERLKVAYHYRSYIGYKNAYLQQLEGQLGK
jgi:carbonic anhydrase/acetyltransferase-like protein (isoleucine patch superfamily)